MSADLTLSAGRGRRNQEVEGWESCAQWRTFCHSGQTLSASDNLRDVIIRGRPMPMDGLTYRLAIRIVAASSIPPSPTWTV
jgi:hypothetical protein